MQEKVIIIVKHGLRCHLAQIKRIVVLCIILIEPKLKDAGFHQELIPSVHHPLFDFPAQAQLTLNKNFFLLLLFSRLANQGPELDYIENRLRPFKGLSKFKWVRLGPGLGLL